MNIHYSIKALSIISVFLISLISSVTTGHTGHAKNQQQNLSQKIVSTPITRASNGHVLVDGKINSLSQKVVVDTGGIGVGGVITTNVLSQITTVQKSMESVEVQGANHSRAMNITQIDSVEIADVMLEDLSFVISPKPVLPKDNIETLIGSGYLQNFVVEFDLKDNKLVLYPRNYSLEKIINQDEDKWSTTKFDDFGGSGAILFDMLVGSHPVTAILDTGSRHIIINWKAAKLLGLSKTSALVKVETAESTGLHGGGPMTSYSAELASLSLVDNGVKAENIQIKISDMAAFKPLFGDAAAVNLGINFFNNRRLVIDYANKVLAITQ